MNLLEKKDDFGAQLWSTSAELQLEFDGSAHHMNSGILAQNLNHGIGLIRVTPLPVPGRMLKTSRTSTQHLMWKAKIGLKSSRTVSEDFMGFPQISVFLDNYWSSVLAQKLFSFVITNSGSVAELMTKVRLATFDMRKFPSYQVRETWKSCKLKKTWRSFEVDISWIFFWENLH